MNPVNVRFFYGGQFVSKKTKTTYEKRRDLSYGVKDYMGVEEVCFMEFFDWIKELGYQLGELWFRKHGKSLHTGRVQFKSDADIPEFMQSKEKDGWHHLYLINPSMTLDPAHVYSYTGFDSMPNFTHTQASQSRSKLPIRSRAKKGGVSHSVPLVEEDTGDLDVTDDSDEDVLLSDEDLEDVNDDDIFNSSHPIPIPEPTDDMLLQYIDNYDGEDNENTGDLPSDMELNDTDDDLVSQVGSDEDVTNYKTFNPETDFKGSVELTKGLRFPSNTVLRKAIRYNAIEKGYNYYYLHNNQKRVSVYCARRCGCPVSKGRILKCTCTSKLKCTFKIHARKLKDEASWQIKSIRPEHICGHQHINPKVTSQYLAERYLDDFRDDPCLKIKNFIKRARREVRAEIGYYKAYYARVRALRMIFGDATAEYEKVWDYAHAIIKYNPGSTAVVKCEGIENDKPTFQRMYICLQPCKEGFISGCRPIIGVDGTHLKGPYPGILLTAVGKDGNNNIFPVAWAVVETESSETWTWFLELLRGDISSVASHVTWVHESDDLTFMSDRQKGLLDAFGVVLPNAETRYCCRHIWSNFKAKFPGVIYKEHFWKAARSSAKHHFNAHMENIKAVNVEAFNYLTSIPACHWSRHAFSSSSKSGMLLNNCCESFNSVLREARTKPILQLMEWIRRYVMQRFYSKKEGLKSFHGKIMPSVLKYVQMGLEKAVNMRVKQADLYEFEVDHDDDTYVVNLQTRSCGCYRWSLTGIPCWHALACMQLRRLHFEDFIHHAYHVDTYAKAYSPSFRAMPGQKQWEVTPFPRPKPPPYRKMTGRPNKRKRRKEAGEEEERQHVKRAKKQNRCSNCKGLGHYKNKCTMPTQTSNVDTQRPEASTSQQGTMRRKRAKKTVANKGTDKNISQSSDVTSLR